MKTIIAAIDFSAVSLNAADYAADLASVIGSDLALIHVFHLPLTYSEVPAPASNVEELRSDAEERLKEISAQAVERTGGKIRAHTEVRQGDIIMEIEDYCSKMHPYAVVMGAEKAGAFERILFGGKTISAIRQLSWPLIVIPPGVKFANIRKIGLACDFRNVAHTIPFEEITKMVNEFHAELHVLHGTTETGELFSEETIAASGSLQEMLGGLNPKYHFINDPDTEKGVADFAEKNNIDLLIVIPKRHNIVSRVFQHSHSTRIVLQSHVPVMTIHE